MRKAITIFFICPLLLMGKNYLECEPFADGEIGIIGFSKNEPLQLNGLSNFKGLVIDMRDYSGSDFEAFLQKGPKLPYQGPIVILARESKEPVLQLINDKGGAIVLGEEITPPKWGYWIQPANHFQKMIPQLTKNSALRKENDHNWQQFSKKLTGYGKEDLQKREAINIIKDMIFLSDVPQRGM